MTQDLHDVSAIRGLSATQEGMLYHSLSEPDADIFRSQVITTLTPGLDIDSFRRAWETMIERHETLRTAFFWDGLDQSLQVVRPDTRLQWGILDWSELESKDFADRLEIFLEQDGFEGFALDEPPLMRMHLIRRPDRHWVWIWTFHHMILDGWSVRVLMRELSELYADPSASMPEPVPPSRYIDWQTALDLDRSRRYWTENLAHVTGPQHLELPGIRPNGVGHDRRDVQLSPELAESLRKAASTQRVTVSAMVTAAWSLVVSAMDASPDVLVGVTTSGRPPQLPGVENMVGLFLNTLPLASRVEEGVKVGEYLAEVHRRQLELAEHQYIGLSEIHRLAGIRGSESLFESIVVFENLPPEKASPGPESFDSLEFRERSNFPLALLATPQDSFQLRLVFDRSRFAPEAAETLLETTVRTLEQLVDSELDLRDVALTSNSETELSGPETSPAEMTVIARIQEIVTQKPSETALATQSESISYQEMWDRVTDLAAHYRHVGLGRGDRIGVMVPRSIDLIVALLAVLRAGAAYVPLDPSYPRKHLDLIATEAGLSAVVVADEITSPLSIEALSLETPAGGARDAPNLPELDDVAYVIHTSGSTGRPKGVVVRHSNLAASTEARTSFYGEPVGAFLLLSSASFDSSVAGIFWTLTTGGTLVLPNENGERDMSHLRSLMGKRDITHLLALPALYQVMTEEIGSLPESLDYVIVAGEAVDRSVIDAHFRACNARLFNEYGPSEATVWSTVTELSPRSDHSIIGKPIANTHARVLDHLGNPVPPGFAGELTIGGPGVVDGYLNDAVATKRAFYHRSGRRWYRTGDRCAITESGEIRFLGRIDSQFKVRGHRIEPGEVEAALRSLPGVTDATATVVEVNGTKTLIGYVQGEVDLALLRVELIDRLPSHLVPGLLQAVDQIPRLPNGKIDLKALPEPDSERRTVRQPPTTATEKALAVIWEELLELDDVGIDEDFFDLGGDSILAIKMVSQARRQGLEVDPSDAVANPTVRELATAAEHDGDAPQATRCLVPIRTGGEQTPLICIHAVNGRILPFRNLAEHLDSNQPVYAFTAAGLKGREAPMDSIPGMAARYVQELKTLQPQGPYRLLGECFGGSIGLEMARLLEEQGDVVSQVVVIDGALPWEDVRAVSVPAKVRRAFRDGGVSEVFKGGWRRVVRRLRQTKDVHLGDTDARFEVYRQRVFEASLAAFGRFTPSPVEAPILLIKATEDSRPKGDHYAQPHWGEFTSNLIETYVDTDHLSILREPGVSEVARLVAKYE